MGSYLTCVSCIERDHEENGVKALDLRESLQAVGQKEAGGEAAVKYIFGVVGNRRFDLDQERDLDAHGGREEFLYEFLDAQTSRIIGTSYELTFAADGTDIAGKTFQTQTESGRNVTWRVASVRSGDAKYLTIEILRSDSESQCGNVDVLEYARNFKRSRLNDDKELQCRLNAIEKAQCDDIDMLEHAHNFKGSQLSDDKELQDRINAIVNARAERCKQSAGLESFSSGEIAVIDAQVGAAVRSHEFYKQSPVASSDNAGLQEQINAIVGAHSRSLKQQRVSLDLASPSPAKSVSDLELEYFANLALSRAKERQAPASSPPPLSQWSSFDYDVQPCQLSFAGCDSSVEAEQDSMAKDEPSPILAPYTSAIETPQKCVDTSEMDARPFNVTDIPSPTRNRAKRQQLWAELEAQATAKEDPEKELAEGEQQECTAVADEAASLKDTQAIWLRKFEEQAEMAAMDKLCVETFLESVKKCAWRSSVRTPIKGSNLYTKHMRPCRPAGTSVDVKDSSFRNLGAFLQFLEAEGLLCLKPGLTDPVVTQIYFDACRRYKYNAHQQECFLAATKEAPHEGGCSCRLCTPVTLASPATDTLWQ